MNTKELQAKFNIARSTINLWIKRGMPYSRLGFNKLQFDLESVENWMHKEQEKMKLEKEIQQQNKEVK